MHNLLVMIAMASFPAVIILFALPAIGRRL